MAITFRTVTGNVHKLLGATLPVRDVSVRWRSSNVAAGLPLIDKANNRFLLGADTVDVDENGDFTTGPQLIDHATGSTDVNPTGVQYYVDLVYNDPVTRKRTTLPLGPYSVTADGDLSDLVNQQAELPDFRSDFMDQALAILAQQVDVSNIATTDDLVEALVKNTGGVGPKTSAALLTSIDARAAAVFNVKDARFGAVGNGTADDTTAIQTAIDAAEATMGGTVYFPRGDYKITTSLTIQSANSDPDSPSWQSGGIHLVGESARDSRLISTGGVLLNFDDNQSAFCSVEKMALKGPGKTTSGSIAIQTNITPMLRLDQVYIRDFETATTAYDCTGWLWTGVRVRYCANAMKLGYNSDAMVFVNCEWTDNDNGPLIGWATGGFTGSSQNCTGVHFIACVFSYTTAAGVPVWITDIDAQVTFDSCYWEGNPDLDVRIGVSGRTDGRGAQVQFRNCFHSATISPPNDVAVDIYGRPAVLFDGCRTDGDNRYTVFCKVNDSTNTQVEIVRSRINAVTAALQVGSRNYATTVEHREHIKWSGQETEVYDFVSWPTDKPGKKSIFHTGANQTFESWNRRTSADATVNELSIRDVNGVIRLQGVTAGGIAGTEVAALPTPSADYYGIIVYLVGGTGVADIPYQCLKDSSGAYVWTALTGGVGPTGPAGAGSYGVPRTAEYGSMPNSGALGIGAADRVRWFRVRDTGSISNLSFYLGAAGTGGTVVVGVYGNTGSGTAAKPTGAPTATGSVVIASGAAAGLRTVALSGTVNPADGDWFAIGSSTTQPAFLGQVGIGMPAMSYSLDSALSGTTMPTLAVQTLVASSVCMSIFGS